MHGIGYWILHFVFAAASMFLLLVGIDYVSGVREPALVNTLVWALLAAAVFTGARFKRGRKG